ncbi:hypothetical protein B0T18DRAFT_399203 [Schizothecium vesticola]|uniref:Uncharacterized protein n=1 Tax=Schizothecium vesticola TaxID=314040 RepID=A0AA40KD30_9PEZI|nr:hypothetical protein B0T18DRAFT_399203 [Schizothecium vesticola]
MVATQRIKSRHRLPNVRRPGDSTLSERQQRTQEKFDKYEIETIQNEEDFTNDDTKAHRKWLMGIWNRYFLDNKVDPDEIWTGLCKGEKNAITWCKTFFSDYVENSVRRVLVLGPEEYEDRRILNHVSSLLAM